MSRVPYPRPFVPAAPGGGAAAPASVAADDISDAGATGVALVQADTPSEALATLGLSGDPGMPSSGLLVGWRASALGLSDGDPVGTWASSVGSLTLTGSGGSRPTYRAAGSPSGGPCVAFTGSHVLSCTPTGLPAGSDPGTIVAIVSRSVSVGGAYDHVVIYGDGNTAKARGLASQNDVWKTHEWASSVVGPSSVPRTPAPRVLGHVYDGSAVALWVDGAPVASNSIALSTLLTNLCVGDRIAGGSQPGNFRLMELAIYDRALTDAQWAQVMAHARAAHGF